MKSELKLDSTVFILYRKFAESDITLEFPYSKRPIQPNRDTMV
jgi:hypothetical protein